MDYIIFPSDYFDGKQVETEYLSEYQACQAYTQTIIFNYEKSFEENRLILNQANLEPGIAIYRGWMMTPKQYQSFYSQLRDKYQIELLTSPEQYEQFHYLSGIDRRYTQNVDLSIRDQGRYRKNSFTDVGIYD